MNFCEISKNEFNEWLSMGLALWPHAKKDALEKEFKILLASPGHKTFICKNDDTPVAFINLSLRNDYVEGSTTTPVGYIEGIYVKPEFRNKSVAKELVEVAEKWAFQLGCKEMGSDTEIENIESQKFHKNIGFTEAGRIVSFIKKIENGSQHIR